MSKRDVAYTFATRTWHNINRRTVNGDRKDRSNPGSLNYIKRGIEIRFTRAEFFAWCLSQTQVIWDIHGAEQTPSINRIDSLGHYEPGNVEVIPLRANLNQKRPAKRNSVTSRLNSLPPRYCLACGKLLQRNRIDAEKSETITQFRRRKTCNTSCRSRAHGFQPGHDTPSPRHPTKT